MRKLFITVNRKGKIVLVTVGIKGIGEAIFKALSANRALSIRKIYIEYN